jgi:hypothetical protein
MRAHYKFWPKRLPHRITPPATSLWDNLAISARRYPDKAALVFFGRVFSYQDVLQKAERLAARLAVLGVQKGDRVVLNMQNCPQLVIAHFAILRANAVVVPVNPMNRAEELKHYITDPDAKVALTTSDLAAELARASEALPEAQRLAHLIVTHFTDAFDGNVTGADAPPEAWSDWLLTHHALPPLARRRGAFVARRAGQRSAAARPGRGPGRPVDLALHQRHHRPAQGLHAHARQRHAQRHGQRHLGQWHARERHAGRGAHVPHHRHGQRDAHHHPGRCLTGHHAALGSRTRRPADLALESHALDQHPHHGDRPAGQPKL